jgi:hypothetical protein
MLPRLSLRVSGHLVRATIRPIRRPVYMASKSSTRRLTSSVNAGILLRQPPGPRSLPNWSVGGVYLPADQHGSFDALLQPVRLWSRAEVLTRPSPVPAAPGAYAWFFRELPWPLDTVACVQYHGLTLLYVGIAPKRPPARAAPSRQTLRSRLRDHFAGNAFGSTLRLALGCLLADRLGITLQQVGGGARLTFSSGEATLSARMADNARVCWAEHPEPWLLEEQLIQTISHQPCRPPRR